jgi:hypothetical protein
MKVKMKVVMEMEMDIDMEAYPRGQSTTFEEVKETEEHNFHCQPEMMIEWIFEQGKVSFNVEKA